MRSGVMRDGLLDGDIEDHKKSTFVGEVAYLGTDWEKTDIEHYNMGVRTGSEENQAWVYSAVCGFAHAGRREFWDWS